MQIAILGASSQISKGLIKIFARKNSYHLRLFVRDKAALKKWLASQGIEENFSIHHYDEFVTNIQIDIIINCVGVGDPSKLDQLGATILETTKTFDDLALNYLNHNPETKYIFFSSGAVYGNIFSVPADDTSQALINLNFQTSADFYALSKLYAEARHRALSDLNIVDLRVFSFISDDLDINGEFFISQAVKAAINQITFITNSTNIVRDYIGPEDLASLIEVIIKAPKINGSFDCYSSKPTDKFLILDFLSSELNLIFTVENTLDANSHKNFKENYYSLNHKANNLGFKPMYGSLENIQKSVIKVTDSQK
jgi:nucleoside-diphosphate-sugar epimerase